MIPLLPTTLANGILNEFFLLIIQLLEPLVLCPLGRELNTLLHSLSREWWTSNQYDKWKIARTSSLNIMTYPQITCLPIMHTKADVIVTTFPNTSHYHNMQCRFLLHTSFHLHHVFYDEPSTGVDSVLVDTAPPIQSTPEPDSVFKRNYDTKIVQPDRVQLSIPLLQWTPSPVGLNTYSFFVINLINELFLRPNPHPMNWTRKSMADLNCQQWFVSNFVLY